MAPLSGHGPASSRLFALALAMLLSSLGTSIANVALPSLQTAFSATFGEVQWVVLAYLLVVTSTIVGAGRLGDLVGRRRLLLGGLAVFALASGAAALAPDLAFLIAARAVQGLGAAIMMALTVASVTDVVARERTGAAMGLLGTVSAVGTALGPSLGGALVSWAGWPAVFAVLAGAGAATLLVGLRYLPASAAVDSRPASFDFPGMLLLALALGSYALATTLGGGSPGAFNALLAVLSIVGVVAFILVERRSASPLLRIELLAERRLSSALLSLGLVTTIVMATLVVGPFYLSDVLGLRPVETGLVMSIGPGVAALVGIPAGRLVDAYGSERVAVAGLVAVALGSVLMMILPGWLGAGGYVVGLAVITAGYALFQAANSTSVMADAPQDCRGLTSALLGLARNLGLVTGASAMGAIFALGSNGVATIGLAAGRETGMMLTFAAAAVLAVVALAITIGARGERPAPLEWNSNR